MRTATVVGLCVAAMGAGGCGLPSGSIHDSSSARWVMQTQAPPRFVRTVFGTASAGSLFCAIPLGGDLYLRAMDDLHERAGHLHAYEFLDNIREDVSSPCLVLYASRTVTVSADLYEVRAPTASPFPMDPEGSR